MRVLEDTNTERVSSWLQVRLEATTVVSVIPHVAGHHTPSEHEAAMHCQGHTHVEQTEAIGTTWAFDWAVRCDQKGGGINLITQIRQLHP